MNRCFFLTKHLYNSYQYISIFIVVSVGGLIILVKKLQLDCSEELWKSVQKYKIDNSLNSNNEAVIRLITKGLIMYKGEE